MSAALRYCAFHGDPALKAEMVGRVRDRWAQRQVFPLSYLKWRTDGGVVSLSGALAQTQVPEQFIERTGLPLELASLCEGLVYSGAEFIEDKSAPSGLAMGGSETILAFALEWLDAIPLGADLGGVVPRFMHSFLASVLAPGFAMSAHVSPEVRACGEKILALWEREMNGLQVTPKEWRSLRATAVRASEDQGDPWGDPLSELVESLAWPARGLAPEYVPIFQVFVKELRQFIMAPRLATEDREILTQSLVGLRAVNRAQRDPALSQLPFERLLERDPGSQRAVMTFMHQDMQDRIAAARQQARPEADRMLRQQMDSLRSLIETAGSPEADKA